MSYILLWILAVSGFNFFSVPFFYKASFHEISPSSLFAYEIKSMLHQQAPDLNVSVINKVLMSLQCAATYKVDSKPILTVIDYSLPSNQKRLWVFDLKEKKLLFHTYVSHGITSGTLLTDYFSNQYNSKASSLGVYKTEKAYYGREGLSLRLDGLDRHFNDNVSNRSIVMHGGWYMEEEFIKRYGRPGRSWGCPALPLSLYQAIIHTIKENSLLVAYYPSETWFVKSKFLNCNKAEVEKHNTLQKSPETKVSIANEPRDEVLFVYKNIKRAEDNPIVTMSANNYERIFHNQAPLNRMLRRQINHEEYIALSTNEFLNLANQPHEKENEGLNAVHFVVPVIKMIRGYYETQMEIVPLGKIKEVMWKVDTDKNKAISSYSVHFESNPTVFLKGRNQFIRWLGL